MNDLSDMELLYRIQAAGRRGLTEEWDRLWSALESRYAVRDRSAIVNAVGRDGTIADDYLQLVLEKP